MKEYDTIEICEKCRRIRLTVVFLFMVSSVLAGVFWSHVERFGERSALVPALVLTVISFVLIIGLEFVVTKVERESKRLFLQLREKVEEVRLLREEISDLNRSVDILVKDDDNIRNQLLIAGVQRVTKEEEYAQKR